MAQCFKVLAILAFALVAGCSSISEGPIQPSIPNSDLLLNSKLSVPSVEDIFGLEPAQKQEFLTYFNDPNHSTIPARKRLYNFLSQHTANFDYMGQNYTARQAYASKAGNCISLAVLTKALADIANVEVKFQSIFSAPVFDIKNDFVVSSDHVRTFLFESDFVSKRGNEYFFQSLLVIDYLPSAGDIAGPHISEQTFIAMFYRNLATDAVLSGNYNQALALLNTALSFDSTYGSVINLIAVVHRRLNQPELAEQFYEYGLQVATRNVSIINNYALLKQLNGDKEGAQQLLKSFSMSHENDPYQWYVLGKAAIKRGRPADAAIYFNNAIERAPYMHQLYLELALAHYQNNQLGYAKRTLEKAAELANGRDTQQRYFAKLEAIKLSADTN
uniref:TPR domain protein n=1 Tax=Rheinheimera sp. BAL341 TaxID=1708203 RepID=A0A486XKJ3_9GAMM